MILIFPDTFISHWLPRKCKKKSRFDCFFFQISRKNEKNLYQVNQGAHVKLKIPVVKRCLVNFQLYSRILGSPPIAASRLVYIYWSTMHLTLQLAHYMHFPGFRKHQHMFYQILWCSQVPTGSARRMGLHTGYLCSWHVGWVLMLIITCNTRTVHSIQEVFTWIVICSWFLVMW